MVKYDHKEIANATLRQRTPVLILQITLKYVTGKLQLRIEWRGFNDKTARQTRLWVMGSPSGRPAW